MPPLLLLGGAAMFISYWSSPLSNFLPPCYFAYWSMDYWAM